MEAASALPLGVHQKLCRSRQLKRARVGRRADWRMPTKPQPGRLIEKVRSSDGRSVSFKISNHPVQPPTDTLTQFCKQENIPIIAPEVVAAQKEAYKKKMCLQKAKNLSGLFGLNVLAILTLATLGVSCLTWPAQLVYFGFGVCIVLVLYAILLKPARKALYFEYERLYSIMRWNTYQLDTYTDTIPDDALAKARRIRKAFPESKIVVEALYTDTFMRASLTTANGGMEVVHFAHW